MRPGALIATHSHAVARCHRPRNPYNALQRRLLSDMCDDHDFSSTSNASFEEVDRTSGNWSVVMGFMINVRPARGRAGRR